MILEYYVRREVGSAALCFAILTSCLCPLASAHDTAVAETPQSEAWTPLFNSHNLDGWHICVEHTEANTDPEHIIQVEDGAIHIYKDQKEGISWKRSPSPAPRLPAVTNRSQFLFRGGRLPEFSAANPPRKSLS
jgi:hypothetical protein